MKKTCLFALFIFVTVGIVSADAAWIWSPDLGKWVNPRKSAKDSPEDQFGWALSFYNQRNWDRAIEEFDKLPENFHSSHLAAEGVYYAGLSWEQKADLAKAADAFQRLIDRYPYSDRIKDAVQHEFEIANQFASGAKMKLLGIPVLSGQEKAIEVYKHIVRNAPFGTYGAEAQYQIGEVYKRQGEFEEAQKAYQGVVDDYSHSELVAKAKYQIAYCSMQASKKAQYNEKYAERAIEQFEGFKTSYPEDGQAVEADEAIKTLRTNKAMTYFQTASFYEKNKKYASAKLYYQEIVSKYADTPMAEEARKRLDSVLQKETAPEKPKFRLW